MFYKMNFMQVLAYLEKVENQLWKQGFFLQALKYLGFHVFAKASLEDIKRVHLATKDFQKCFYAMVVLCMC